MNFKDVQSLKEFGDHQTFTIDVRRGRSLRQIISIYADLFKLKILGGVAASALLGAFIASSLVPTPQIVLFLLIGTALSYGGAAAWNQVLEVPYDREMLRTKDRPLPAGEFSKRYVATLGSVVALLGVAVLYFFVAELTGLLAITAFVSYVFFYTPLKRVGWWGTLIGTIPGALPALGGAVAVDQSVSPVAGALFSLMIFWQLPHFYSYIWNVKEEYQQAGFCMLPYARKNGLRLMNALVVFGALGCMVSTTLIVAYSPVFSLAWGVVLTAGSLCLLYFSLLFVLKPGPATSKRLFRTTVYFLLFFTVAGLLATF